MNRKQYHQEYYKNNKERLKIQVKENRRKTHERNRRNIIEYFLSHPCVDCGNDDVRVLEFDHIDKKSVEVARLLSCYNDWDRILEEIEKCEVRCANCHKIKTGQRLNSYRNKYYEHTKVQKF